MKDTSMKESFVNSSHHRVTPSPCPNRSTDLELPSQGLFLLLQYRNIFLSTSSDSAMNLYHGRST
jgi:hypothetical protein